MTNIWHIIVHQFRLLMCVDAMSYFDIACRAGWWAWGILSCILYHYIYYILWASFRKHKCVIRPQLFFSVNDLKRILMSTTKSFYRIMSESKQTVMPSLEYLINSVQCMETGFLIWGYIGGWWISDLHGHNKNLSGITIIKSPLIKLIISYIYSFIWDVIIHPCPQLQCQFHRVLDVR